MSKNGYQKVAVAPEIENISTVSYQQQETGSPLKNSDPSIPRSRTVSRSDSFFVPTADSPLLPTKSNLFAWSMIWIVLSGISIYLDYSGSKGPKLMFSTTTIS